MNRAADSREDGSVASPQQSAVDWSVLDALAVLRRPGAPDPRWRLLAVYLNTAPGLMEGIRSAVGKADGPSLMKAAHSLKSGSLNVGATGLGHLCSELERIGRANTLQGAKDLLQQAEAQLAAVSAAFQEVLRQEGQPG